MLGSNVREIWINHRDPRQGPEASLLRRLAAGCPVILRLYDSHAQVVKSIHIDVPPLLHHFAKTALTEVPLLGSWSPDRFNDGKLRLQNRFDLEALWGRVLVQQMAIFSDQGELLPIVCDSAPE
jgi:hypothetical protein